MEAREYLLEARRSKARVDALVERRRWYGQAGQWHSDGEAKAILRLQRELDRRIDDAARYELEAMQRIDALEDPGQREVLCYRYLNGLGWKEIAVRMNLSQDWVKHMHGKALKALKALED
jgi:DNA-directed RNA polymerase specialized sigma subunit